jgi:hypothetical protein
MEPSKRTPRIQLSYAESTARDRPVLRRFACSFNSCSFTCYNYSEYQNHVSSVHDCLACGESFDNLSLHACRYYSQAGQGAETASAVNPGPFRLALSLHGGAIQTFLYDFHDIEPLFETAFMAIEPQLLEFITSFVQMHKGVRMSISLQTSLQRIVDLKELKRKFISPFMRITHQNFVKRNIKASLEYLLASLEVMQEGESGWKLTEVSQMEIRVAIYQPDVIRGRKYIPTPKTLRKREIINVRNFDSRCFIYTVIAGLYRHEIHLPGLKGENWNDLTYSQRTRLKRLWENPKSYFSIISRVNRQREIDFNGFEQAVPLARIPEFSKRNRISINVYSENGKEIYPVLIAEEKYDRHLHMLLLSETKDSKVNYHYALLSRLGAFSGKTNHKKSEVCPFCFSKFHTGLKLHTETCSVLNNKKLKYETDDFCSFKKYRLYLEVFFKVLFKFIYGKNSLGDEEVTSYGILIVDPNNKIHYQQFYTGPNAVKEFLITFKREVIRINQLIVEKSIPLHTTPALLRKREKATVCPLCQGIYGTKGLHAVLHHHHWGHYVDYAKEERISVICNFCNLRIVKSAVCAISHSFSSKDAMFIIKELPLDMTKGLGIVAKSSDNIMTFMIEKCRFIDSSLFLPESFEKLLARLETLELSGKEPSKFELLYLRFGKNPRLLKPIPPFELAFKIDNTTNDLCTENLLDTSLADVIEENYIVSGPQYQNFLLETHLLQYSSIIQNITEFCMKSFGLDMLQCISLPSYAFQVALSKSRIKYQYLKDDSQIKFIQRALRGPIETSNIRKAVASTERLNCLMGPPEERQEILYVDINSMYAKCCMNRLAVSGYRWLTDYEIKSLDIMNMTPDIGMLIECDLDYPAELHDRDSDMPLAPEKRRISLQELSKLQQLAYHNIQGETNNPFMNERLLLTLHNKKNYVALADNLRYYLSRGLRITKIHKALQFNQENWLRDLMIYSFELRRSATLRGDTIIASFIKSILCQMYGCMLQTTEKYVNIKPCFSKSECIKLIAKPTFKDVISISDHLSLFQMAKTSVKITAPLLCAVQILEYSKLLLYEKWEKIRETFGPNCKLIKIQTDSIACSIPDPQRRFIKTLMSIRDELDFSNLPTDSILYSKYNQCQFGIMKVCSLNIIEIVSIKPKIASILEVCETCKMPYNENCSSCLLTKEKDNLNVPQQIKLRRQHEFYRELADKNLSIKVDTAVCKALIIPRNIGFNTLNFQRFQLDNSIYSLPFGHRLLKNGPGCVPD